MADSEDLFKRMMMTFQKDGAMEPPTERTTTLAPLLSVRDGRRAVAFYRTAFGAEELTLISEDGESIVAQLSVEGAAFWVADESPEYLNFSPESLGGGSVRLILSVADPDAVFDRAVAAGAKVIAKVEDHSYGWRVGRVVDPFGHHWEIGRPTAQ